MPKDGLGMPLPPASATKKTIPPKMEAVGLTGGGCFGTGLGQL